jgi:hypothetical protein
LAQKCIGLKKDHRDARQGVDLQQEVPLLKVWVVSNESLFEAAHPLVAW